MTTIVVVRKGDARAGAVLVKVLNRADGTTRLYAEATRMDGEQVWMQPARSGPSPPKKGSATVVPGSPRNTPTRVLA